MTTYVIDTGIRFSHTEFGGRAVSGYDSVDGGSADDCNGHGTHVSGTVGGTTYGVAKSVRIVGVRVLNCQGSGSSSGVIAGIDWVTNNHTAGAPASANMSLGGGVDTALDTAVRNSIADGITYAIAAGNSNANACQTSRPGSPRPLRWVRRPIPMPGPRSRTTGHAWTSSLPAPTSRRPGTPLTLRPTPSVVPRWPHRTWPGRLRSTCSSSQLLAAGGSRGLVNSATTGVVTNPGTARPTDCSTPSAGRLHRHRHSSSAAPRLRWSAGAVHGLADRYERCRPIPE